MKTTVLLLGCLLATASLAQSTQMRREVWQWVDENGVTHFSDQPTPGARKIVLVGSTPTTSAVSPPSAAAATRGTQRPAATQVQYNSLEIWQPENGASFFGADATVNVRLRSDPAVASGDRLLTYLDGKLLPDENATEHTLSNLDRGVHSLTSVIVDGRGNERIRSAPVVFHIKQPGLDNPRSRGPALRPAPPRPPPAGG